MIDWLKFLLPLTHTEEISGGHIDSTTEDGLSEWTVRKRKYIPGSYDSRLHVRTAPYTSAPGVFAFLEIDGNPVKLFQGHNVFGSDDVRALIIATGLHVCETLGLKPSAHDLFQWRTGNIQLNRVDVTHSYDLGSLPRARSFIAALEQSAYYRRRGPGILRGSTLYYGLHSRRYALKVYSKGAEIHESHALPESISSEISRLADPLVRFELVLRGMELKRQSLRIASNWKPELSYELHSQYMTGLEMAENTMLPDDILQTLSPRIRMAYMNWQSGHDLKSVLPKQTFYRYRNQLLQHGIDIAVQQNPKNEHPNVVPLVTVLEAKPWTPPAWAYDRKYYFDPTSADCNRLSVADTSGA